MAACRAADQETDCEADDPKEGDERTESVRVADAGEHRNPDDEQR
jgi:hypothetical protein